MATESKKRPAAYSSAKQLIDCRKKASIDEASRLEDARCTGYVEAVAEAHAHEYEGKENYAQVYAEAYVQAYNKVNVQICKSATDNVDMARQMLLSGIDAAMVAKYSGVSEEMVRKLSK